MNDVWDMGVPGIYQIIWLRTLLLYKSRLVETHKTLLSRMKLIPLNVPRWKTWGISPNENSQNPFSDHLELLWYNECMHLSLDSFIPYKLKEYIAKSQWQLFWNISKSSLNKTIKFLGIQTLVHISYTILS